MAISKRYSRKQALALALVARVAYHEHDPARVPARLSQALGQGRLPTLDGVSLDTWIPDRCG